MYRGSKPRILPFIIAIIVIALIIAGLVSLGRVLLVGDTGEQPATDEKISLRDEVLNTDYGRSVRYTVRGPIVADENFKTYQITVSPTTRTYAIYTGYLERIESTKSYPNSERAYDEFVNALDKNDISKTREAKEDDMRGVCATNGRAYAFETRSGGTTTQSIWTATCAGSKGSMAASVSKIHALFANQIPDFEPVFDKTQ